jgi:uncharacterized membrane protein YebE (DUF533 family)
VLNNVTDVLSVVLMGSLGRSGRKSATRATKFLTGHRGFLGTSALMAAAGVAWGIYDTLQAQNAPASAVPGVPSVPQVPTGAGQFIPPIPTTATSEVASVAAALSPTLAGVGSSVAGLDPVTRIIRLAVSAAKADGTLGDAERTLIMERAREAGLESVVEAELSQTRQLADIVRGVTDPAMKNELYILAFTIVRADENVSGAERIYLAQLAHKLGLDAAAAQALETETANKIDSQTEN